MSTKPDCLYEHSNESLLELMRAIQALGFDEETAGDYAARIGDCPIFDPDGKIVVLDEHGKVIDRLALDFFGEPPPKALTFDDRLKSLSLDPDLLREFLAALRGGQPVIQEAKKRIVVYQDGRAVAWIRFNCLKRAEPQGEILYLDGEPGSRP